MQQLIRTTITLPDDLFNQLKMKSATEDTSVSGLITKLLRKNYYQINREKINKEPLASLGKFSLGVKKIYKNRDKLYENHLQGKLGV